MYGYGLTVNRTSLDADNTLFLGPVVAGSEDHIFELITADSYYKLLAK